MKLHSAEDETANRSTRSLHVPREGSTLSTGADMSAHARQVRIAEIRSRLALGSYRIVSDQIAAKLVEDMLQNAREADCQLDHLDRERNGDV